MSAGSAFEETLNVLTQFWEAQGLSLASSITEDSLLVLVCRGGLINVAQAFRKAADIVHLGGRVEIDLRMYGRESVRFTSSGTPNQWIIEGKIEAAFESLSSVEPPDRWETDRLVAAVESAGDGLTGEAVTTEDKRRWRDPLEAQNQRVVWIGPHWLGFVKWLHELPWTAVVETLWAKSGALILVADWTGAPVDMGVIMFGPLDLRSPPSVGEPLSWPESVNRAFLRAARVNLGRAIPEAVETLAGIVGCAAASALGTVDQHGQFRPHSAASTVWMLPTQPSARPEGVAAIANLVRWVLNDPNQTRLVIARNMAASRIDTALKGPAAASVLESAEIAYAQAIDEHVQRSLATQVELERSFRAFDSELAAVQVSLSNAVDQVIVRVFAGSLATAIAALTSKQVRGWPTFVAAMAIAAYALFSAFWQLRWQKQAAEDRFTSFNAVVADRGLTLSTRVQENLASWKKRINRRVSGAQAILVIVTILVLGGGAIAGAAGSHSVGTPKSTTTQPSVTPS